MIGSSELIINRDGSIFHLHLKPEQLADQVILVGDPKRVDMITNFFSSTEFKIQNREFVSVTGIYNSQRITVVSTGIGTDNIDIVINELDALANIDFKTREIKDEIKSLKFIRIGTSGGMQDFLDVNSYVVSKAAIGFDGLINFYAGRNTVSNTDFENKFMNHVGWNPKLAKPYLAKCSSSLYQKIINKNFIPGITISAPGFYGPQGRKLRLDIVDKHMNKKIRSFEYEGNKITNFEMECSAIYGLSALLGHEALTVCLIIANRLSKQANDAYIPKMKELVKLVLDQLTKD